MKAQNMKAKNMIKPKNLFMLNLVSLNKSTLNICTFFLSLICLFSSSMLNSAIDAKLETLKTSLTGLHKSVSDLKNATSKLVSTDPGAKSLVALQKQLETLKNQLAGATTTVTTGGGGGAGGGTGGPETGGGTATTAKEEEIKKTETAEEIESKIQQLSTDLNAYAKNINVNKSKITSSKKEKVDKERALDSIGKIPFPQKFIQEEKNITTLTDIKNFLQADDFQIALGIKDGKKPLKQEQLIEFLKNMDSLVTLLIKKTELTKPTSKGIGKKGFPTPGTAGAKTEVKKEETPKKATPEQLAILEKFTERTPDQKLLGTFKPKDISDKDGMFLSTLAKTFAKDDFLSDITSIEKLEETQLNKAITLLNSDKETIFHKAIGIEDKGLRNELAKLLQEEKDKRQKKQNQDTLFAQKVKTLSEHKAAFTTDSFVNVLSSGFDKIPEEDRVTLILTIWDEWLNKISINNFIIALTLTKLDEILSDANQDAINEKFKQKLNLSSVKNLFTPIKLKLNTKKLKSEFKNLQQEIEAITPFLALINTIIEREQQAQNSPERQQAITERELKQAALKKEYDEAKAIYDKEQDKLDPTAIPDPSAPPPLPPILEILPAIPPAKITYTPEEFKIFVDFCQIGGDKERPLLAPELFTKLTSQQQTTLKNTISATLSLKNLQPFNHGDLRKKLKETLQKIGIEIMRLAPQVKKIVLDITSTDGGEAKKTPISPTKVEMSAEDLLTAREIAKEKARKRKEKEAAKATPGGGAGGGAGGSPGGGAGSGADETKTEAKEIQAIEYDFLDLPTYEYQVLYNTVFYTQRNQIEKDTKIIPEIVNTIGKAFFEKYVLNGCFQFLETNDSDRSKSQFDSSYVQREYFLGIVKIVMTGFFGANRLDQGTIRTKESTIDEVIRNTEPFENHEDQEKFKTELKKIAPQAFNLFNGLDALDIKIESGEAIGADREPLINQLGTNTYNQYDIDVFDKAYHATIQFGRNVTTWRSDLTNWQKRDEMKSISDPRLNDLILGLLAQVSEKEREKYLKLYTDGKSIFDLSKQNTWKREPKNRYLIGASDALKGKVEIIARVTKGDTQKAFQNLQKFLETNESYSIGFVPEELDTLIVEPKQADAQLKKLKAKLLQRERAEEIVKAIQRRPDFKTKRTPTFFINRMQQFLGDIYTTSSGLKITSNDVTQEDWILVFGIMCSEDTYKDTISTKVFIDFLTNKLKIQSTDKYNLLTNAFDDPKIQALVTKIAKPT